MGKLFIALIGLCLLITTMLIPYRTASAQASDTLGPGMNLTVGQSLVSIDGWWRLQMQGDGNLVLVVATTGVPIWATNTRGAVRLSMQLDGNLVLYTSRNTPVWASNTGSGRSLLRVQNDRNVVIYREGGGSVWATNTAEPIQKYVTFPQLLKAGDCEMYNAALRFGSDGKGAFTSSTLTRHTHSGDVWHASFDVKDRYGNTLFSLGEWSSPRMDEHGPDHAPPRGDYDFDASFSYDPSLFGRISSAIIHSRC